MVGMLYPEKWRPGIYLGAQSASGEPLASLFRRRYSRWRAASTPDDQIGVLVGIGDNQLA